MEQVLGKLVARACYVSKKILEDIQNGEENINIQERFAMCRTDTSKTLQICNAIRSSPSGNVIYESLKVFESLLSAFENNCIALLNNRFDFQLRQTVQTSHKELAAQLNAILALLESNETPKPPKATPNPGSISNKARTVAMSIRLLNDHAMSGDIEKFVPVAKQSFLQMKELQQLLIEDVGDKPTLLAQKVGKLSIMVIRNGKELCQHPSDTTKHEFTLSKQAIAQQLQDILFYAQEKQSTHTETPGSPLLRADTTPTITEQTITELKKEAEKSTTTQQKPNKPAIVQEQKSDKKERKRKSKKMSPKNKRRTASQGSVASPLIPKRSKDFDSVAGKLESKPLFLLHGKEAPVESKAVSGSRRASVQPNNLSLSTNDINRSQTVRNELTTSTPVPGGISSRRKATSQTWKDSLSIQSNDKLDAIVALLGSHLPNITEQWEEIDNTVRCDLRDQVEDQFLRHELEERLQVHSGQVSGSLELITSTCLSFVVDMCNCIRNLDETFLASREQKWKESYHSFLSAMIGITSTASHVFTTLESVTLSTLEKIQSFQEADFEMKDDAFVTAASQSSFSYHGPVKALLGHHTNAIYIIATQLLGLVKFMKVKGRANEMRLIGLLSTARTLAEEIAALILDFQTAKAIAINKRNPSQISILEREDLEELVDIDIWVGSAKETGTVNAIVRHLTSEYDTTFMKTVIYTYRSFTTPEALLGKLIRRFQVPPGVPDKEAMAIQLRVCVVLKYWIQHQFLDFDSVLVEEVTNFVKHIRGAGHTQMADGIELQLKERKAAQDASGTGFQLSPVQLRFPDVTTTPLEYFMSFSVEEIAKQITLLDSAQLCKIQPSELMSQSWTNKKTKHQSMNVCWCMDRLNMISFWVPTVVLSHSSLGARKRAVEWFYSLCVELRKINNFQSLMAIVAGFNNAACQRLKHTFDSVDKDLAKKYQAMEDLMSPQSSFKNYRQAIKKAHLPVVPFLGVYLSDLVFIDEGNPDANDGKINFEKRKLVYGVIQDLQLYQSSSFTFPILQPLNQFLSFVPTLSDSQLYDLSLKREPRGATREEIL